MFNKIYNDYMFECTQADNEYHSSILRFALSVCEAAQSIDENASFMTAYEAENGIMESIKEFFRKLIQSVKDFVKRIIDSIQRKYREVEINKKLNELKRSYAKANVNPNAKVKIIDYMRYQRAFSKYINVLKSEFNKMITRTYNTENDFAAAINAFSSNIELYADKLNLSHPEAFEIEKTYIQAFNDVEVVIKNGANNCVLNGKDWIDVLRTAEQFSDIKGNNKFSVYVDKIKTAAQVFSNKCAEIFSKVSKTPVFMVSAIVAGLAGLGVGIYTVNGIIRDHKNAELLDEYEKNIPGITPEDRERLDRGQQEWIDKLGTVDEIS